MYATSNLSFQMYASQTYASQMYAPLTFRTRCTHLALFGPDVRNFQFLWCVHLDRKLRSEDAYIWNARLKFAVQMHATFTLRIRCTFLLPFRSTCTHTTLSSPQGHTQSPTVASAWRRRTGLAACRPSPWCPAGLWRASAARRTTAPRHTTTVFGIVDRDSVDDV